MWSQGQRACDYPWDDKSMGCCWDVTSQAMDLREKRDRSSPLLVTLWFHQYYNYGSHSMFELIVLWYLRSLNCGQEPCLDPHSLA